MANYIVPRVQIEQEFTQVAIFGEQPLAAFIIGPQYKLFRYSETNERPLCAVVNPNDADLANSYVSDEDVAYEYPNRVAGSVVDQDYVQVFMENLEAQYFPNDDLGSLTDVVAKVAIPASANYYSNRVRSATAVWKTANSVDRSSVFSNRDVVVGDVAQITDGSTTLTTKVAGFAAEVIASSIGTVTRDDDNAPVVSADINDAPVWNAGGSAPGTVTLANDSTAYVGHIDLGVVVDTYTFTVTTAGNLSAVRFSVSSANNVFAEKTNQALQTISGDDDILLIDDDSTNDVRIDFTGSTVFTVGDSWTLLQTALVTSVLPVGAGTYAGTKDLSYKLTVVRGGPFYTGSNASTCARVSVTSTDIDSSAAVNVAAATPFAVGTQGVTASFASVVADDGLILGDIYYLPVVAEAAGAIKTLIIRDSLTASLLAAGSLTIKLFLTRSSAEIAATRDLISDTINWETDADLITVKSGITVTDTNLVVGDDLVNLPVSSGLLFVQHRDLLQDNTISIGSCSDTGNVDALLGTIHPDNPLAEAVYQAVLNSAGTVVYFVGIPTDDLAGYNAALLLAKHTNKVYGFVPLTNDKVIQDTIVAHVNTMSTSVNAKWRVAWLSLPLVANQLLYDLQVGGSNWLATVSDDPLSSTVSYNLVSIPSATLITDGVRPGDEVFINFRLAADGTTIHDTYVVASVRTETTLLLTTGLPAAVNSGIKVQLERIYTKDEQIDHLAAVAGSYLNRRVRAVFPDSVKAGTQVLNGYFVAAALAGLRSGVVPHQGLTNIELLGFDDTTKSVITFSEEQLNTLAAAGVWIVTQRAIGATPYTRHQLTTDSSGINTSEDSITTNVDSISYGMQVVLDPFIGVYNRNVEALTLIRNAIDNELRFRQTGTFTQRAGNQLIGYTINKLAPNVTFKDRIDVSITLDVPAPINKIILTFIV